MNTRWGVLAGLNISAAVAGGGFGVIAMLNPGVLPGFGVVRSPGIVFYTEMYGLRAVVLAIVTIVTMICADEWGVSGVVAVLVVASLVQLGDLAIAIADQTSGIMGAAIAASIHLGTIPLVPRRWGSATRSRGTSN